MTIEIREETRENWGTRTGFVLAAVGSAVGLGNLWGFPYKLYSYGGGAFLIPYVLALVLIGIPMLIMEISLGHRSQRAAPDAFARANPRFEIVGWWGILLGFVIITYYPVILAYCFSYLGFSILGILRGGDLPWAGDGIEGVRNAKSFFFDNYLAYHESFSLGALRGNIILPLILAWVCMYLCIFKGVKLVGRIVWLTVPLPWLMLLVLAVRGLTLPGAGEGIAFYLSPDWRELAKPDTWRFAIGQVFFSMSLAFGVMITYASFLHRKSDVNNNAAIIGLADLATSFVAGLAIFATLGGMAWATTQGGQPVPVEQVVDGGPGLAFVAFPYALAQLPYSAWFSFIFFLALVTLGIDSAFSITESVLAGIVDKTGWRRAVVLPVMSLVGLLAGLLYIHQGGLNWLGTVDAFINGTWGIAFMGLLQCLVLGWLYRIEKLRVHANASSDWRLGAWWDGLIRLVIPVALGALVMWSFFDDVTRESGFLRSPDGQWIWPNIAGLGIVFAAPIVALMFTLMKDVRQPDVDEEPPAHDRETGIPGALMAGVSMVFLAASFVATHAIAMADDRVNSAGAAGLLAGCILAGFTGMVMSHQVVQRETTTTTSPSWLVRWAGLLATVGTGGGVGLLLALNTTRQAVVPRQAAAYVVLTVILTILTVGLTWCIRRAREADRRQVSAGVTEA